MSTWTNCSNNCCCYFPVTFSGCHAGRRTTFPPAESSRWPCHSKTLSSFAWIQFQPEYIFWQHGSARRNETTGPWAQRDGGLVLVPAINRNWRPSWHGSRASGPGSSPPTTTRWCRRCKTLPASHCFSRPISCWDPYQHAAAAVPR